MSFSNRIYVGNLSFDLLYEKMKEIIMIFEMGSII
jgi:hypothetical protein